MSAATITMDIQGNNKNNCVSYNIAYNSGGQTSPHSSCGISLVVVYFVIHLLLVLAPAWSYFQYDFVSLKLHLEEPRVFADEAVVQTNRAIGLTAWIWVIPVNICAIVGLSCCTTATPRGQQQHEVAMPSLWPFTVSYLLLGTAMYWPIQFLSSRLTYSSADIDHVGLQTSDVLTLILVLSFAMLSTWYLSSYQMSLLHDARRLQGYGVLRDLEEESHIGSILSKSQQNDANEQTPLQPTK
jgi:hypothetical protein